jgi:hypothetical protein
MELVLISAAAISLVLAAVMSVVAWHLLRDSRERSAARVATLETLAFSGSAGSTGSSDAPEPDVLADFPEEPRDWDLALGTTHEEPAWDDEPDLAYRPATREVAPRRSLHRPHRDSAPAFAPASAPVAVPDGMFAARASEPAPPRRWVALAAVALVVAAGSTAAYGLSGSGPLAGLSLPAGLISASHSTNGTPLELLSLRHGTNAAGNFTVTGLVQNPMDGREVRSVVAVVYLFDRQGRYFATGRATLEPASLHPGEESPFVVSIADVTEVGRYRVGFRFADGGVVAHVDRRGHEPDGTTGGALGDSPQAVVPVASPRGTEGE